MIIIHKGYNADLKKDFCGTVQFMEDNKRTSTTKKIMRLNYLEAEQNAEVPRRLVIEGVNQIYAFDHSLFQGLCVWLPNVNCQRRLFITVFALGKTNRAKANKSSIQQFHFSEQHQIKNNVFL